MKIRHAVILDDHQLFADSFSLMLEKYLLFEQVHVFSTTDEFESFLGLLGKQEVYIFLDYYLQGKTGLSMVPEIKRVNKKACIIFITSATSPAVIHNIALSKPHGIISKLCDVGTMIECVKQIEAKGSYIDPRSNELLQQSQKTPPKFTSKELELLRHFADGLSIAETAEKVYLSKHTIIAHRRKMMAKTNSNSIGHLIKYARDHELI